MNAVFESPKKGKEKGKEEGKIKIQNANNIFNQNFDY